MIPFNSLKPLHDLLADEINRAILRVADSGWYILGPEVKAFEGEFAAYHGVPYAVGVASGTDALELALRAGEIGEGDEVITVAHTAMATVTAIESTGAIPVLVDIDPRTFTIEPTKVAEALTPKTRAIIAVHIYGQPADLDALKKISDAHDLILIEDCAQSHGAKYKGQIVGSIGHFGAFSFYPTKNMGAYGDGGMVITRDAQLAENLQMLRNYGQTTRYTHISRGTNSRLDEMQAAILRVKLAHLDEHNQRRREIAAIYDEFLHGITIPYTSPDVEHAYHLYVARSNNRDPLMADLKENGVGTLIHYPIPIHLQTSHRDLGVSEGNLPETEKAAREILSLPMYIGLSDDEVRQVCDAINRLAN